MRQGMRMQDNDLLDIRKLDIPKTVSLRLKCGKCGCIGAYTFEKVYIDSELYDQSNHAPDCVSFDAYFRCRKCKSAWPWELTPDAYLALTALMTSKLAGLNDERLVFACPRMYDGTPFRSAAQAEEHMLDVLEREPKNAFAWSRLGNVYRRAGMVPKASKAFARALELDPNDIDSHYSLGDMLFDKGKYKQSAEHLHRVLALARDNRRLAEADLRNTVRSALLTLSDMASRTDGEIEVFPSNADGRGPSDQPKTLRLESYDLGKEADWERLLDLITGKRQRPVVRDMPPISQPRRKTGRNEPCPCGSGKKYKKCCGR